MRSAQAGLPISRYSVRSPRAGVTLAELLVALVIMSVIAGVATLSLGRMDPVKSAPLWHESLATARNRALAEAHQVTIEVSVTGEIHYLTALPDGRVVGDALLGIDPLTGEIADAEEK